MNAIARQTGAAPRSVSPGEAGAPPGPTRRVRIPDIDLVEIPGGPFVYQQGETRELPTFWMGRYPVTNAQFQAFADDGGYEDPRW